MCRIQEDTKMCDSLKTYPVPHEAELSGDYSLLVNGREVHVYKARVSAMPFNQVWPGYQRPIDQTELASFGYWDMTGPVEVEVISSRPVKEVVIRPLARGIIPTVKNNRITFTMPGPGPCTVEINGVHFALHLFGKPFEGATPDFGQGRVLDASVYKELYTRKPAPDPKDFEVLFFPPGIYEVGKITVRPGQTVYISGGAVVYGVIEGRHASGIRILGRGILDGSHVPRINTFGVTSPVQPFGTILLYDCEDVEISGIVIRDSNCYAITPIACRRVRIADVSIIGQWRYNTDGIDLLNCENVLIEKCFVRTFDDSIVIAGISDVSILGDYQIGNRPSRDITVRDCVIWNDWGRALEIGALTHAEEITDVAYLNCDIIHTTHVALDIQNGDHALVRNISYEDIRVELDDHAQTPVFQKHLMEKYRDDGHGTYCPLLFVLEVKSLIYSVSKERGHISHVSLRNVRTIGSKIPKSYMAGYDAQHQVDDVTIDHLRIGDCLVTDTSTGCISTHAHVQNVVFNPDRTSRLSYSSERPSLVSGGGL